MEQDNVIKVYLEHSREGADDANIKYINLKVQGQDSNEIHFRVKL